MDRGCDQIWLYWIYDFIFFLFYFFKGIYLILESLLGLLFIFIGKLVMENEYRIMELDK